MSELKTMFDQNFKFSSNETVRHRADTKSITADMGLLILQRVLVESLDDENNSVYERFYHCRMIKFSGSGEVARFSEKELMSLKEYEENKMKEDFERNQMRQDAKRVEEEVMELFDIEKEDYVYLIKEGQPDKSKKYRMSGFHVSNEGIKLSLRESLLTVNNQEVQRERVEVSSKDEFIKCETNAG
jgi:hypothetical protein